MTNPASGRWVKGLPGDSWFDDDGEKWNLKMNRHNTIQRGGLCVRWLSLTVFISVASAQDIPTNYPTGPGPMNIVVGADGKLIYQPDTNGDTIPDISMCGYMGGGVPLPTNIPVVMTLNPVGGDNLAQIQNAINTVGNMPLQTNGFRGAILLKAGVYPVSNSILINRSGIVLRGEGDGPNGTVLEMTGGNLTILTMDNNGTSASEVPNTRHNITDPYVPVGAKWCHVDSTNGWAVGDTIKVVRVCTTNWLAVINQTNWSASAFYVKWDRVITALSSNRIAWDMPITQGIDTNNHFGGGYIYKYTFPGRLTNCAFEDLRGICTNNVNTNGVTDGNFITLHNVMNCWVRRCENYQMSGHTSETDGDSKWITFEDLVSYHTYVPSHSGASIQINRYEGATGILYHRVTTSDGGFEFSSSGLTPGPNAIVECDIPHGFANTGPHMKWAVATFYDALYMNQALSVQDQGLNSSHGWAGANQIAWNVETASSFNFDRPQTCHQMVIGGIGSFGGNRVGTLPPEIISKNAHVMPHCLYRQQLTERLGSRRVLDVLGAPYGDNFYVLTAQTNTQSVSPGQTVTNSIVMTIVAPMPYTNSTALAANMFTNYQGSSVSFNVSGLPPNVTASFNPPALNTNGTTMLTIATTTSTPGGSYPLVIRGRGLFKAINGATFYLTNYDTMTLNVANFVNFSVAAAPDSQSLTAGEGTNFSVIVTPTNNFSGDVTLSVSGVPTNASASFNPTLIAGSSGTSTLTIITSNNTPANAYALTIVGTDANGGSAAASVNLSIAPAPGTLPSPWADTDLGSPVLAGEGTFSNHVFMVQSAGTNLAGTADEGNFVYQPFSSDMILSARVASQQNTGSGLAKSGVMIRETTDADSRFVGVVVTPGNGVLMEYRPSPGASVVDVGGPNLTAPCWLKLTRAGNLFAGYSSPDGTNWTQIGATSISMADPVSVGLVVCSHDPAQINTSLMDNVILLGPDFLISMTPDAQTVNAGLGASYTINIVPTNGFSGSVSLSESDDLTADANAALSVNSLTLPGSAVLTVDTATTTPQDNYTLTVTATSGSLTHNYSVTLTVASLLPAGLWTGASGEDIIWSDGQNWGNGSFPGASDNVKFYDLGAAETAGAVNNIVDTDTTIASLQYGNTNGFHTTQIAPGATLTVTGSAGANGYPFFVGTASDNGATQIVDATITGAGGALVVNNPSASVNFGQGSAITPMAERAILDMSGLDTFSATLANFYLGYQPANDSTHPGRPTATVVLAKTNTMSLSGSLLVSKAASDGTTTGNILYLGQTNVIFANSIITSEGKGGLGNTMRFNPALNGLNPVAYFRGAGGGASRVSLWAIGYANASSGANDSIGTNDFSSGVVDALVDTMLVGRGQAANNGARQGNGTLTFNAGTINVNTLQIGYQVPGNSSFGVGVVNVNGSGKLVVNNAIGLGFTGANPSTSTKGTLNITDGTVWANSITNSGSGTSAVFVSGGALVATNAVGTPAFPIPSITLANAAVHLQLNGNNLFTNVVTTNLAASGVSTIVIDAITNLSSTMTFPLVAYGSSSGTVTGNFALSLPPGFSGNLVDNATQKRIDLSVNVASPPPPRIGSISISDGNLILTGTNGVSGETSYLLMSTNLALPLDQWLPVATNQFDSNGNCVFTNAGNSDAAHFYLLKLP